MSSANTRMLTLRQQASAAETAPERLTELAADPKLARLVAGNPNAPAALLLELSHSDDKGVTMNRELPRGVARRQRSGGPSRAKRLKSGAPTR